MSKNYLKNRIYKSTATGNIFTGPGSPTTEMEGLSSGSIGGKRSRLPREKTIMKTERASKNILKSGTSHRDIKNQQRAALSQNSELAACAPSAAHFARSPIESPTSSCCAPRQRRAICPCPRLASPHWCTVLILKNPACEVATLHGVCAAG